MNNLHLVYQAKSFYNAYIALEQRKTYDADCELLLWIPALVNGAFSAELTIKAILVEQGISYDNDHNLKILFEKLPVDIQNRIWEYLAKKAPEFSDAAKRENELLLMSEAFVQWRYCYEGKAAPAFDARFLSAFANVLITIMFELGYNVDLIETKREYSPEELAEIDTKFENNRSENIKLNQEIILKKNRRGKV